MPSLFYVSYFVMWLLLMILVVLVLLIYRHFGLISLGTAEATQRDGLMIGEAAPTLRGLSSENENVEWTPALGRTYLFAFVSPTCGPCQKILPFIIQLATASKDFEVVLIVNGPRVLVQKLADQFHPSLLATCLSDEKGEIYQNYRVRVMPFAFLVGPDRSILAKGLCDTPERLQGLLRAGGIEIPTVPVESVLRKV